MLKINLNPIRSDEAQSTVSYTAPILTVDGVDYDLSELPDGATAQHPVLGTVNRTGTDYELTLKLTHGAKAPEATRFPVPIEVITDGPVELPVYGALEKPEIAGELNEAALVVYTGLAQHSVLRDLLNTKSGITWIEGTSWFNRRWHIEGPYETLNEIKTTWEGMY